MGMSTRLCLILYSIPNVHDCVWLQEVPSSGSQSSWWHILEFWNGSSYWHSEPLVSAPVPMLWCEFVGRIIALYVRSFTGFVQSFMFLRRNQIMFALLTVFWMRVPHDSSSLIVTSRYLLESTTSKVWPCSSYWVGSTFFFSEILNTTHLMGLKLICQVFSQCSSAEMSFWRAQEQQDSPLGYPGEDFCRFRPDSIKDHSLFSVAEKGLYSSLAIPLTP